MTLTGYMSGLFAAVLPKPRTNPKVRRPAVDAEDGSFRRQREGTRQRLTHYLDGRRFLAEVASLYGRLS